MTPTRSPERTAVILVASVLSLVTVSVFFAPLVFAQGCAISFVQTDPWCSSYPPRTLLGYEANVWLWGVAVLVVGVTTFWLLRRAMPRPEANLLGELHLSR